MISSAPVAMAGNPVQVLPVHTRCALYVECGGAPHKENLACLASSFCVRLWLHENLARRSIANNHEN